MSNVPQPDRPGGRPRIETGAIPPGTGRRWAIGAGLLGVVLLAIAVTIQLSGGSSGWFYTLTVIGTAGIFYAGFLCVRLSDPRSSR